MIESVLSLLGIAKKAGRVEIGEEPVGAAARAKKARVILVAADAGPSSQRRAFSFAESGACLCLTVPADKDALGRALGRSSVAMCAVTEIGLAGAIVKKLSAMDAEKYGAASAQLDVKARRAMERRAEQLRHEKNLRQGKHRVHSDKPPEPQAADRTAPRKDEHVGRKSVRSRDKAPLHTGKRPAELKAQGGGKPGPQRKAAPRPQSRFAGALPVKRGKGSRKDSGR